MFTTTDSNQRCLSDTDGNRTNKNRGVHPNILIPGLQVVHILLGAVTPERETFLGSDHWKVPWRGHIQQSPIERPYKPNSEESQHCSRLPTEESENKKQ